MFSQPAKIEPEMYGGHGKNPSEPAVDLKGKVLNSRCPPVVSLETIIIAVAGPSDDLDMASPKRDGWFLSDFYLFHHLFRNTAHKQSWLTCVKPTTLIEKYGEYVSGNPRTSERRVVLDASFEDQLDDVHYIPGEHLGSQFLSYVANASKDVRGTNRPILIMIFGHGEQFTGAITIGSATNDSKHALTREDFHNAITKHNPRPSATVLAVSCYSGTWAQYTTGTTSVMAGADNETKILSWPLSKSCARACGSRWATALTQSLLRTELEEYNMEAADNKESATYAALHKSIHDVLKYEVDVREDGNDISFSAQDDAWDMDYRARTGFTLGHFQHRWESLRKVPKGEYGGSGSQGGTSRSLSGSIKLSDGFRLHKPATLNILKSQARLYLNSHPGETSQATNISVFSSCLRVLEATSANELQDYVLEGFARSMRYRLEKVMGQCNTYKRRLNIDFPDCQDCDPPKYLSKYRKDQQLSKKQEAIYDMVRHDKLFDWQPQDGHKYTKGSEYMIVMLIESGWDREKVVAALSACAKWREEGSDISFTRDTIIRTGRNNSIKDTMMAYVKSAGHSLRSRAPVKRSSPRKSLEGVFDGLSLHGNRK